MATHSYSALSLPPASSPSASSKMIKKKIEKVVNVVTRKSLGILGIERRSHRAKRQYIDAYITVIQPSVNVSREDIAIIVTGFISEMRKLPSEIIIDIIKDDG